MNKPNPPCIRNVAIITDGNGRWAQARGLPANKGHEAGADTLKARLRDAVALGIKELTVYSFSTENWSRPADEVRSLIAMLARRIVDERSTPVPGRDSYALCWAAERQPLERSSSGCGGQKT